MKNKKLLIILGFILLALGFYWFQVRPSRIRSSCANKTVEGLQEDTEKRSTEEWQAKYDLSYKACINEKGLR